MKKIALFTLTLAAAFGGVSSALAASNEACPPSGACDATLCCEIKCAEGESVAAAQKRVVFAELALLVTRYVSDASLRSELLRTLKTDPERALDFVALKKAAFSETDHATFKRVSGHFKC
jgi:hypothetical protein